MEKEYAELDDEFERLVQKIAYLNRKYSGWWLQEWRMGQKEMYAGWAKEMRRLVHRTGL